MIPKNIGYVILEGDTSYNDNRDLKVIGERNNGKLVAEAVLQTANERNRNGRFYPSEELFPQLTSPRTLELLNNHDLRGELGHPLSKELARQQTIDDKVTAVEFIKLWTEGDNVCGQYTTTNNQYGKALNEDMKEGRKPAFSLRALGSVENTSRGAEVRKLSLITYDTVIYPSHPGAYTRAIVSESGMVTGTEENNDAKCDSMIIPITNEKVLNYIKSESCNLKLMKECYDFMYDSIQINEKDASVTLTDKDGNIFVISLEDHIHNEIYKYTDSVREYFEE